MKCAVATPANSVRAKCRVLDSGTNAGAASLLDDLPGSIEVWMSHADQVQEVHGDFVPLAATETCPIAAIRHQSKPIFGLQFHPEVTHTPLGATILKNFLTGICECETGWTMQNFADRAIEEIRERGRRRSCDLRIVRGCRLGGHGGPDQPRDRRPIVLYFGRQRIAEKGRSAIGCFANSPIISKLISMSWMAASVFCPHWPVSSIRKKRESGLERHSSSASRTKQRKLKMWPSSLKAHCTPT